MFLYSTLNLYKCITLLVSALSVLRSVRRESMFLFWAKEDGTQMTLIVMIKEDKINVLKSFFIITICVICVLLIVNFFIYILMPITQTSSTCSVFPFQFSKN